MSTIVTRAGKGSQLSWTEVDANFTNLNTDKIQSSNAGTTGQVLTKTSTGAEWAAAASGGFPMIMFQFSNPAVRSGGTYQCEVTELVDTSNIASVSSTYNFSLPAGTYILLWANKGYWLGSISDRNTDFAFTSNSGDATISNIGLFVPGYQTAAEDGYIWCQNNMRMVLTQTTSYSLTFTYNNSTLIPQFLTLIKVS